MSKEKNAAKDQIQKRVLELATLERRTSLTARVGLARCITALQTLSGDVTGNGKPSYLQSREKVLHWLKAAGSDITDVVLQQATYIAIRLNNHRIAGLNKAGMSFRQVYELLATHANKAPSSLRREIAGTRRRLFHQILERTGAHQ